MVTKKFKTIVIHIALNGVSQDLIYELLEPTSFMDAQIILNKSNTSYAIVTTEGVIGLSPSAVIGFELSDPVDE